MSIPFETIIATFWGDEERAYAWLGNGDDRFRRRGRDVVVHPTSKDWRNYCEALAGLEAIKAYDNVGWHVCVYNRDDDPYPIIEEPKDRTVHEHTESLEEWLTRCRQLRAEIEGGAVT